MVIPTPPPAWTLHSQLAQDTDPIGDLPLSRLLVIKDANFPWLLLVPRRLGVSDIIDLDEVAQAQLATETARVSRALRDATGCDKLNVAALGNVVPQLHLHVIARHKGDIAWPKPVWGAAPLRPYERGELSRFVAAIRARVWVD